MKLHKENNIAKESKMTLKDTWGTVIFKSDTSIWPSSTEMMYNFLHESTECHNSDNTIQTAYAVVQDLQIPYSFTLPCYMINMPSVQAIRLLITELINLDIRGLFTVFSHVLYSFSENNGSSIHFFWSPTWTGTKLLTE